MTRGGRVALTLATALLAVAGYGQAPEDDVVEPTAEPLLRAELGGDVRYFQFVGLEGSVGEEHAERGALRLKLDAELGERWRFEGHGLLQGASPPALGGGFSLSQGRATRYFDVDAELDANDDRTIVSDIDRFNVRFDGRHLRLTLGRQAITWGVNYFWPVLDLFAPFSPERIDRDYKPGVDALRLTVPVGQFSEIEVIGALQGRETREDRSLAALGRFHLGNADVGFMIGDFHRDRVLGAFLTGDVRGSLLRAEVSFTSTSDRAREEGDPDDFVRATLGLDRLLTQSLSFVFETTYNGYGTNEPADILGLFGRERVRRGEITSFGRIASGVAVSWQTHPLLGLTGAALVSWSDGSVLLQPSGVWSLTNNGDLLFGGFLGLGDSSETEIASEYGATQATVWAALRWAF
ncbi:MAG: hypothetical protein AAF690_16965 [Acidobacteriota bacterium]